MVAVPNRTSPLPLWAQIEDDLRRRLTNGEFENRFPTDGELVLNYGVSRHTVREAVRRLAGDGLLVRERGRGTSLSYPMLEQPLHSLYSLASSMRVQGIEEHSEVRSVQYQEVTGSAATELGLAPDDDVVYIERLRFADGVPIAWDRSWLPASSTSKLLDADLTHGSIYDALASHCGLRVTSGWERIQPLVPTPQGRKILGLPMNVAVFSIERLVMVGDAPTEWRQSLIRGDRYSLLAQWPANSVQSFSGENEETIYGD